MTGKAWWQSKTIWVNALALAGAIVVAFGLPEQQWVVIAPAILAGANLFLRIITGQPIEGAP